MDGGMTNRREKSHPVQKSDHGRSEHSTPLAEGDAHRFQRVAVVGAGLMGRRIAGTFAAAGLEVTLTDRQTNLLEDAGREARSILDERGSAHGTVEVRRTLAEAVDGVDLVTEAVIEDLGVKRRLFADITAINPSAILASNSSVLPISLIASDLDDRSRAIGTHWWNPPDLIPVVEVIPGEHTNLVTVADVMALMRRVGKEPVWVHQDVPGFVGNRLQHALWREAIALVANGVADAKTVDLVARKTIGLRLAQMGPIENADYIGLELTRAIHEAVFPALDRSTAPSPLLDELLAAGRHGAASGGGFLNWPPGSRSAAGTALAAHVGASIARESADRHGDTPVEASTTSTRSEGDT
ncbi:3-hydroxybutyryl-CoA dehydrogenase [Marmoricola sp. URHA0025 HA25]